MDISTAAKELKATLSAIYGNRFSKLLLYGSYARQDFNDESDVDFMLVLKDEEVNPYREIANLNPILSELLLRYGKVFSLAATSDEKFRNWNSSFYYFVRKEGVEV